jgi:hypothetical protein
MTTTIARDPSSSSPNSKFRLRTVDFRSFWRCLEEIPGLIALPAVWRHWTSENFGPFQTLCLQVSSRLATHVSCPLNCGCNHFIIHRHDGTGAIAVCRCESEACADFPVTLADITHLEVSWTRLGRALCKALGLENKTAKLSLPATVQIGCWSADAVPVILTIQSDSDVFRHVIAELGLRLARPFILLAPTNLHMTANCDELLAHARAAFFPLETTVTLTDNGTLVSKTIPGELFARFTPEEKLPEDAAMRAFAIAKSLDSEQGTRKAPLFSVFRLYCTQTISVEQVAKRLHCSKATIINRLRLLRKRTGTDPKNLRAYSAQFSRIEDSLSDSRARHIYRKPEIHPEDSPESED